MTSNPKHLKSGSECPTLKENQLRLYSMRFCPFVRRAKLVLAAKNVDFEEVRIDLGDQPDWYLKKNPVGEVPLLEWIDKDSKETRSIPESLIVCDYLDKLYPQNRLHPTDPYLKAQHQVLTSRFNSVYSEFYKVFGESSAKNIEDLNQSLVVYEQALQNKFFGGAKPAMVDYMIWPWFEMMSNLTGYVLNADGKLPKVAAWVKAMDADEAVRKYRVPDEIIKKFIASRKAGKTDFDVE